MAVLYRQHCHRQPVWLFSDTELDSLSEQPEELLLAILAITTRFSASAHFRHRDRNDMSQRFGDAARNLVMLKIANGGVGLGTIQSLCLLAWAEFAGLFIHSLSLWGTERGPIGPRMIQRSLPS